MQTDKRLPIALATLRLSVFLVMLVWTMDKLLAPGHASSVFGKFYFIGDSATKSCTPSGSQS